MRQWCAFSEWNSWVLLRWGQWTLELAAEIYWSLGVAWRGPSTAVYGPSGHGTGCIMCQESMTQSQGMWLKMSPICPFWRAKRMALWSGLMYWVQLAARIPTTRVPVQGPSCVCGWEVRRDVDLLSQPYKRGRKGCCESPRRNYEASKAGVLLYARDFVAPHSPGIWEETTLALLFFLFRLTISSVPKGLACWRLPIPCWRSHLCCCTLCSALPCTLGLGTTLLLSEQQT